MCFLCTLRRSCVPPFIPLYLLLHHPPFHSNGQSGIDIISLEDPSLCQSLFIYSMATGLIMVPLPLSLPYSHPSSSLPLSLSPDALGFLLKRISRLHKWFCVRPHYEQAPAESLQALAQVYCSRLDEDSDNMLTIHHLLTVG